MLHLLPVHFFSAVDDEGFGYGGPLATVVKDRVVRVSRTTALLAIARSPQYCSLALIAQMLGPDRVKFLKER